jgi:hypothetical protein
MEDTGNDNHNGEDSGDITHSLGYVLDMYDIWVSLKMTCLPIKRPRKCGSWRQIRLDGVFCFPLKKSDKPMFVFGWRALFAKKHICCDLVL